jgi:hypothetical protein
MSKEAMTLALEALKWFTAAEPWDEPDVSKAIKALEEALAKQEQGEPVAWMKEGWGPDCGPYIEFYRDDEMGWRDRKEWTPLYTTPQPAQKPLTDEQIYDMYNEPRSDAEMLAFARAIEAAHGIKENT